MKFQHQLDVSTKVPLRILTLRRPGDLPCQEDDLATALSLSEFPAR
jgi:hypothetical protein